MKSARRDEQYLVQKSRTSIWYKDTRDGKTPTLYLRKIDQIQVERNKQSDVSLFFADKSTNSTWMTYLILTQIMFSFC